MRNLSLKSVIIWPAIFLVSSFVHASPIPEDVQKIFSGLHESMVKCPERIWPGFDFKDKQVVIVNSEAGWLWDGARPQEALRTFALQDLLPEYANGSDFSTAPWNGRSTVAVKIPGSLGSVVDLAAHEAFHSYYQRSWTPIAGENRGDNYPEQAMARYYRQQIEVALKEAYLNTDRESEFLASAAWWAQKYKQEFSREEAMSKDIDRAEESASFVGEATAVIGELGCGASDSAFEAAMKSLLQKPERAGALTGRDWEYYDIGLKAALLLKRRAVAQWTSRVEKGELPLEVLLDQVTPVSQADDEVLLGKVKEQVDQMNKKYSQTLDPLLETYGSNESLWLAIPATSERGSFSGNLVNPTTLSEDISIVERITARYETDSGSKVELNQFNAALLISDSPCGAYWVAVPVDAHSLKLAENARFSINDGHGLSAEGTYRDVRKSSGQRWICAL